MTPDQENTNNIHQTAIIKDLSDIKASLAVNTAETSTIKDNIKEIKTDIKEIKSDFVNRREFTEGLQTLREEISPLKKFIYGLIAFVLLAFIGAVINLVLMK